jgi:alkyl sulfatase BDS1-like metallo-beta-lactamase superfamily hydrolase
VTDLRDYCDRLWNGEIDTTFDAHPVGTPYNNRQAEEVADGILYYKGISGVTTLDAGASLVMLDTGGRGDTENIHSAVRDWRPDRRLAAAVFSHHHGDHIYGTGPFEQEADERGIARPLVYGHELMGAHFDRKKDYPGWERAINMRQFLFDGTRTMEDMSGQTELPAEGMLSAAGRSPDFRYPDVTYQHRLQFSEGDLTFALTHTRGETEDATWTWVPQLKLLAPGDLFIWAVPNAGNPQKVQRWVGEWATGLRQMAALGAELMIPGHGFPIFGADRVSVALTDTADLLESIQSQTIALMNTGASLDTVIHSVEVSEEAMEKPYLRPVYDHPQFLIRNIWRFYGGWYDGEPDNLLPAPRSEQARVWVELAGGLESVLARASALREEGNLRLACHVIEFAVRVEPDSKEAHELRAEIFAARAELQTSSMARGIFGFAAASSRRGKRDAFE